MTATLRCNACRQVKPVDDFYQSRTRSTGREARCIACDNTRQRQTPKRILRNRARQRATAALVSEHREEFRALYEHCYEVIVEEFELLAAQPAAQQHPGEVVRLRPGKHRDGEDILDRIDTERGERCEHCRRAHSSGHSCPECGATPRQAALSSLKIDKTEFRRVALTGVSNRYLADLFEIDVEQAKQLRDALAGAA